MRERCTRQRAANVHLRARTGLRFLRRLLPQFRGAISDSADQVKPDFEAVQSIILPSSSMSMWPLLILRCHLAHCQQIRSKTRAIFSEFRPAVFVEKLEYPLEIFNLFFTQDSVWIYDFLVVYRLFLAYTMPNNEMTNERANKQRKRVCTHQIKDRTQLDRRKHTTMHVTHTHTCFPLSLFALDYLCWL